MTIDSVDEVVKLLIGFSLAFAVTGISYQLMRLIAKLANSIQDFRGTIQNTTKFSDSLLKDYEGLKKNIGGIFGKVTLAKNIGNVLNWGAKFKRNKKDSSVEKVEKVEKV